jgi:hypothetical protein
VRPATLLREQGHDSHVPSDAILTERHARCVETELGTLLGKYS